MYIHQVWINLAAFQGPHKFAICLLDCTSLRFDLVACFEVSTNNLNYHFVISSTGHRTMGNQSYVTERCSGEVKL